MPSVFSLIGADIATLRLHCETAAVHQSTVGKADVTQPHYWLCAGMHFMSQAPLLHVCAAGQPLLSQRV